VKAAMRRNEPVPAVDPDHDGLFDAKAAPEDSALQTGHSVSRYLDDAWITARVRTVLLKEVKLAGLDVEVDTLHGLVRLSGQVDSPSRLAAAERAVAGIEGVKRIRNDLRLRAPR